MFGLFNIAPGATPEQIARNRRIIEQMMPNGRARYAGEGLVDLASGILGGMAARRNNRAEDEMLRAQLEMGGQPDLVGEAVRRANTRPTARPMRGSDILAGGGGNDMLAGGGVALPRDPASLPPQVTLGPHTMGARDMLGRDYGYGGPVGPQYPNEAFSQMAPSPGVLPQGNPVMPSRLPPVSAPNMPPRGEVRGLSEPFDPEMMGAEMEALKRDFQRQPLSKGDRTRRQEQFSLPAFNTTEGQVLGYTMRAAEANRVLNALEQQGTRWGQRAMEMLPKNTENLLRDDEFQQYLNAEQNFLAAVLRRDTGAAITREEFDLYRPMFFPQPGDGPGVIEQKRRMRESALAAMAAGTAEGFDLLPEDVRGLLSPGQPLPATPANPQVGDQPQPTHRFNPATGQIEAIK